MKSTMRTRLAKLEARGIASRSTNRVVIYNSKHETAEQALRRAGSGSFMLVPVFGTNDEWKHALLQQQTELHKMGAGY